MARYATSTRRASAHRPPPPDEDVEMEDAHQHNSDDDASGDPDDDHKDDDDDDDDELDEDDEDAEGEPDDAHTAVSGHRSTAPTEELSTELTDRLLDLVRLLREYEENGRDVAGPFAKLVNRRNIPEYYEVIKEPVAFSTLRVRLAKKEYKNVREFVRDGALIFHNAQVYNRQGSTIFKDATTLREFFKAELQKLVNNGMISAEDIQLPYFGELPSESPTPPPLEEEEEEGDEEDAEDDEDDDPEDQSPLKKLGRGKWIRPGRKAAATAVKVAAHEDSRRKRRNTTLAMLTPLEGRIESLMSQLEKARNKRGELARHFAKLPDARTNPYFYEVVTNPISFDTIRRKFKAKKYLHIDEVVRDLNTVFENAKKANTPETDIYQDAVELQRQALAIAEQQKQRTDEDFRSSSGKLSLPAVTYNGETWAIGDWVHIANASEPSRPMVAQIFNIWEDDRRQPWINVCWYYYPHQTVHHIDKRFYDNEVFKTGHHADYLLQHVMGRCFVMFVSMYEKGRPRGIAPNTPVYVCEARYNEVTRKFKKIKSWPTCLPPEVRDKEYEIVEHEQWPNMAKHPSPIRHLLRADAKEYDPLPKATYLDNSRPPTVGAVHIRPHELSESPQQSPGPAHTLSLSAQAPALSAVVYPGAMYHQAHNMAAAPHGAAPYPTGQYGGPRPIPAVQPGQVPTLAVGPAAAIPGAASGMPQSTSHFPQHFPAPQHTQPLASLPQTPGYRPGSLPPQNITHSPSQHPGSHLPPKYQQQHQSQHQQPAVPMHTAQHFVPTSPAPRPQYPHQPAHQPTYQQLPQQRHPQLLHPSQNHHTLPTHSQVHPHGQMHAQITPQQTQYQHHQPQFAPQIQPQAQQPPRPSSQQTQSYYVASPRLPSRSGMPPSAPSVQQQFPTTAHHSSFSPAPQHFNYAPSPRMSSRSGVALAASPAQQPHATIQSHYSPSPAAFSQAQEPQVFVLAPQTDSLIPPHVRKQFQHDEHGRILFFAKPPLNNKSGASTKYAHLGHSARFLADRARDLKSKTESGALTSKSQSQKLREDDRQAASTTTTTTTSSSSSSSSLSSRAAIQLDGVNALVKADSNPSVKLTIPADALEKTDPRYRDFELLEAAVRSQCGDMAWEAFTNWLMTMQFGTSLISQSLGNWRDAKESIRLDKQRQQQQQQQQQRFGSASSPGATVAIMDSVDKPVKMWKINHMRAEAQKMRQQTARQADLDHTNKWIVELAGYLCEKKLQKLATA